MTKYFAMLIAAMMILGCSSARYISYADAMNMYVKDNIQTVVDTWGYPTEAITAPNGNKVYAYLFTDGEKSVKGSDYGFGLFSSKISDSSKKCKTYFEVDRYNSIVRVRWEGNDCKAFVYIKDDHESLCIWDPTPPGNWKFIRSLK